jgi:hypothetical protein
MTLRCIFPIPVKCLPFEEDRLLLELSLDPEAPKKTRPKIRCA